MLQHITDNKILHTLCDILCGLEGKNKHIVFLLCKGGEASNHYSIPTTEQHRRIKRQTKSSAFVT